MTASPMNPNTKTETLVEKAITTESPLNQLTNDNRLPIEKLSDNLKEFELSEKEIEHRETLIDDLLKAQRFTVNALYHYIKLGHKLNGFKEELKKGRFLPFVNSIGLNERTAQRYMKIAKDERFLNMSENELSKTFHLTQTKMIKMTNITDRNEFQKALNNENYIFESKKATEKSIPKDFIIDKELYQVFLDKSKDYVINEYNTLFEKYSDLEKELKSLKTKPNQNNKDS